jgi:hypothetical protein
LERVRWDGRRCHCFGLVFETVNLNRTSGGR